MIDHYYYDIRLSIQAPGFIHVAALVSRPKRP